MSLVPNFPGVPEMPSYGPLPSLVLDIQELTALFSPDVEWGIFDSSNNKVIDSDSVLDMSFKAGSRIADFPVEQGQFANYNKVQSPDAVTVTLTKGGTLAERDAFLKALDAAKKSLELYNVVTPEATYINANIESYDYRRGQSDGANSIKANVALREIREVDVQYTKTSLSADKVKNPASADPESRGKVQPKDVPESTAHKLIGKVGQQ